MLYYFVKLATSEFGPFNFAVAVAPGKTIAEAVNDEGLQRRLVICHDWQAEPIDEPVYRDLAGTGGETHAIASL